MYFTENRTTELNEMKSDASMNYMLVAFCIILIGFVALNCRMNDKLSKKQSQIEQKATVIK